MKLLSIQLHNFRQFYGTTPKIQFAAGGERNVTVFHGVNGAGKTALLNAFTWVLYGKHTRGFKLEEQLVNRRALSEAVNGTRLDVWVELEFRYRQKDHILRKTRAVTRGEAIDQTANIIEEVQLLYRDDSGELKREESYIETIGRILPEDLHHYFFFDGERIERLVQPSLDEQRDIAKAAKKLLRIEVLERAEYRLQKAKKELESELRAIGSPQTVQLLQAKDMCESRLGELEQKRQQINSNVSALQDQRRALTQRLSEVQEVREVT